VLFDVDQTTDTRIIARLVRCTPTLPTAVQARARARWLAAFARFPHTAMLHQRRRCPRLTS